MRKVLGLMTVAALLAACDDRSAEDTTTGGGGVIGEDSADGTTTLGDVQSIAYDAGATSAASTLNVRITLDGPDEPQSYVRDQAGDLGGYSKFTQQDDPLDRSYVAFAKTSADGSVTAIAISDGGNFGNAPFGGAQVSSTGVSLPTTGLVSYAGDYVGVIPDAAASGPGTVDAVTGTVFLNVEFADIANIEGEITDRAFGPNGTGSPLGDVSLGTTTINADGSFSGTATGGTYTGLFGGTDAASIAGAVEIGDEYGIFVLDQCPGAGDTCLP